MNTQIQWSKVLVIVLAVAGVGVIGFFFFQDWQKNQQAKLVSNSEDRNGLQENKGDTQTVEMRRATESSAPKTILYKNEKYGFSLEFPESWSGYTVKDEGGLIQIYIPSAPYKNILDYPITDIPVLFVDRILKKEAESLGPKCQKIAAAGDYEPICNWLDISSRADYLGVNNQYYFSFRGPVNTAPGINIDDFPITELSPELAKLQEETRRVVASFKSL